jgi:hypothetical protein
MFMTCIFFIAVYKLHVTINLQIWKLSCSIIAIFIALWYYVSTRGITRLKRKLNAFIDIDF